MSATDGNAPLPRVYLCTPRKLGEFNHHLAERIEARGFDVDGSFQTVEDTAPEVSFKRTVTLIRQADIFVVVFRDYEENLNTEVGVAFAWNIPRFGIDYAAPKTDMVCRYVGKLVKPAQVPDALREAVLSTTSPRRF